LKRKKNKKGEYVKVEKGEYFYESFHTSICILCNAKIYTMGYGSDPNFDNVNQGSDTKIMLLKKFEGAIKKVIPALESVQVLGTGFIFSRDSLDIDDIDLNYSIVDIGILKKSNIIRLNKVLSTIKRVRASTMVIGQELEPKTVKVEQLICQTMCIYSRLASRYTQPFPFASQVMNCSSFVELGFPDRINCTAVAGYSDPNSCTSKNFAEKLGNDYKKDPEKIKNLVGAIFASYFGNGNLGDFKQLVGYKSDTPPGVSIFNQVLNAVQTFSGPRLEIIGSSTGNDNLWFFPFAKSGASDASDEKEGGAIIELKLKKRKKHKRPKNATARKSSNK
jgi:hypothetical protein